MLQILTIASIALAPVILIFTYIYFRDKYEREPLGHLILSFVLGAIAAYPVLIIGDILAKALGTNDNSGFIALFFHVLIVIALVEEGMKYAVLRFYNYNLKEFNEPYDGIMYAVAVAMGFAALENILYVTKYGYETGILRMFTAVPSHAAFGTAMGYYVGLAKFEGQIKNATWLHLKGLGLAVIFHTIYDYIILNNWEAIGVSPAVRLLAFVVLWAGIYYGKKALDFHQEVSPFKQQKTIEEMEDENISHS